MNKLSIRGGAAARFFCAGLLGLAAAGAHAQQAGSWILKGGYGYSSPQDKSSTLSAPAVADSRVDVKGAGTLIGSLAYMITPNVSVELIAGLPFEHDIDGAGSADGIGKIASVKAAAPALMLQYRLGQAEDPFRVFGGLGYTYARLYGEKGSSALTAMTNAGGPPTHLDASNDSGPVLQLGATMQVSDQWYIEVSALKAFLKTDVHLSTDQTIHVKLDPIVGLVTLGYRF